MSRNQNIISWIGQLAIGLILLMTVYAKFTSHPDSVETFNVLGVGDAGRYATAVLELIASILVLVPRLGKVAIGAALSLMVMIGALAAHYVGPLGTEGGTVPLAFIVLISSLVVLYLRRSELPF